ncbi:MAG: hypothetical protein AMS18_02335 [Gemmatimonas sp. SG8_17]|nr:MAG: hypothetical protein AMS18_02335 [Gemmatimonas sp. SG8_17]
MASSGGARSATEAANRVFMASFKSGDAAGIADLYTGDGQLLPAQSDFVTGRDAVQAFWQGAMDMGLKEAKLETVELEDHGATAIEVGRYTLFAEGEQVVDAGKYLVVWKNEAGSWKLHRDIWNTSQPASG